MALNRRVLIVVNPVSGGGKAGGRAARLASILAAGGRDCRLVELRRPECGGPAAALPEEESDVVVVGGDGAFNIVLNHAAPALHRLLFFPSGTVNVIARNFGLKRSEEGWAAQMAGGREGRLDVGLCNGRRFFIVAGAGLDGLAARAVALKREGCLRYSDWFEPVLRAALAATGQEIYVDAEGFDSSVAYQYVVVGNCPSYGGPVQITALARPDDGLLDVCAMRIAGPAQLAQTGLAALLRHTHLLRCARYGRVRRAVLRGSGAFYQFDGEWGGTLPVEIGIAPGLLKMVLPA